MKCVCLFLFFPISLGLVRCSHLWSPFLACESDYWRVAEHPQLRVCILFQFSSLFEKSLKKSLWLVLLRVSHFSFLSVQLLLVMKKENLKLRALLLSWTLLILFISFMIQLEVAEIIRASSYLNPFSSCPLRKSILIITSKLKHLFPCSRSGKKMQTASGAILFKGSFHFQHP